MYLISGNITGNVTGNLLVITGNGNIGNITSNFRTLVQTQGAVAQLTKHKLFQRSFELSEDNDLFIYLLCKSYSYNYRTIIKKKNMCISNSIWPITISPQ